MPLAAASNPNIGATAKSQIQQILAQQKTTTNTTGLNWRGTWMNFVTYNVNDVVLFNFSAYVALNTSSNAEPDSNPNSWALLARNLNLRGQFQQLGATDVSHVGFVQSAGGAGSNPTSVATFAAPNTAGNTILVFVSCQHNFISGPVDPGYTFTVTDTLHNTYVPLGSHTYTVASPNIGIDGQVFIAKNVRGGSNSVTVTVSGGIQPPALFQTSAEYSGSPTVNPLINTNVTTIAPNSSSVVSCGVSLSTTQVNQVAIVFGIVSSFGVIGFPSGFTNRGSGAGSYADKIISSATTATYSFTNLDGGNATGATQSVWGVVLTDTAPSATYLPSDVVEYLGSTYLCIQATTVNPITAGTNYWLQLSQGTGGINNLTANYTAVSGDYGKLLTNTSASSYTVTLPSPPPLAAWWIALQNSGTGTIVINPNGLTLDGSSSSLTLAQNQGVLIFTDGTNYFTERGLGTITSLPSIFNVSSTGAATVANEAANTVWAGPSSGGAGPATFRALVTADLSAGILSFNRKVISATSYTTLSSDVGKALDVQTSSATTVTLQVGAPTPAFVRSYGFNRLTGSQTTGTLGGVTLTAGHLAVITVEWYNNTSGTVTDTITVADSNGNTWNKVPNTFIINTAINGGLSATGAGQQLWYSNITVGGAGVTITATFPSTVQYPALYGAEASGVTQVDNSTAAQGNGTPSSGNITTVASSTFVYGSVYDDGGGSSAAGTGWTLLQTTFNQYLNEYRLPVATGTFAATSNFAGTHLYTAAIASFSSPTTTPFSGFIQNNGTAIVAVTPSSGLINGSASITLLPGQGVTIATDGTNFTAVVQVPPIVTGRDDHPAEITGNYGPITLVPSTFPTGFYRVSIYTEVSTGVAASTITPSIAYADDTGAQTQTGAALSGAVAGVIQVLTLPVRFVTGTALTYSTSTASSPKYKIFARAESL
jgi:hypothetical protein